MANSGNTTENPKNLPALIAAAMATAGMAMAAPPAYSQGSLEEIVVTAQRRAESLQDVPLSVAAFNGESLENLGVPGTRELSTLVPSVQMAQSGPSATFFIRGVGNISAGTGEEGTNAFYVDGVYLPSLKQTVMKFNNIERIEVLKGPQGTLFGRNSSGGLVHVITRDPGDRLEARANIGVGNYDSNTAQLYVAGPLTDTLSANLSLTSSNQSDGWGEDVISGKDSGYGWDWGVHSKWVWRPNDETKVAFSAEYSKASSKFSLPFRIEEGDIGALEVRALDDPYDVQSGLPAYSDLETYGFNLTMEFDLGWAYLTSITGGRKNENDSFFDSDMSPLEIINITVVDTEESIQQELRLASASDGAFQWQTGIFLLNIQADLDPQVLTGIGLRGADYAVYSELDTTSYAVFGEVSYELPTATTLTAGVRYTRDELEFEGTQKFLNPPPPPFPGEISAKDDLNDSEPTFRLAVRQELGDAMNVYASYNRGYKTGTFSMSTPTQAPVDPQTIDAYEIGMKSEMLDSRLRLNLALFHHEISDYQVRATTGGDPTPVLLNAAEVEADGVEVDFDFIPVENLRLFGSLAWLDAEFSDFPNGVAYVQNPVFPYGFIELTDVDLSGNTAPMAPDFAASLGLSYTMGLADAGEIDLSLLYSYNDGFFFEADNRLEQESFDVVNASLAYRPNDRWKVELWGRNLGDETYYHQKIQVSAFGGSRTPAAPRTYGINFSYEY